MEKQGLVVFDTMMIDNPEDVLAGGYLVWLTRDNITTERQVIPSTDNSAVFTIVQAGTYVAHVIRLTDGGVGIGVAVDSAPVTVTPDMIAVPLSITLQVN